MSMQFVLIIRKPMQSNVPAKLDTPILVLIPMSFAQVRTHKKSIEWKRTMYSFGLDIVFIDSCKVKNGGCDSNAICSHDSTTFDVKCTCKIGYTNTGSDSSVNCTGNYVRTVCIDARKYMIKCRIDRSIYCYVFIGQNVFPISLYFIHLSFFRQLFGQQW